jgi:hypothetical protein
MAYDVIEKITVSDIAKAMGRKGGIARKAKLSSQRLTEIGKKGAAMRWGKQQNKTIVMPTPNQ